MAQPRYTSKTLTAASVNAIALSQTPLAAGNLTLNGASVSGGVATLNTQRQVLITQAANETGRTFTVYGTTQHGDAIHEAVSGSSAASVHTNESFKTVTRVAVDAATAGALQVGTNGVGSTSWHIVNWHVDPINIGVAVLVTGTVNYTVQHTLEDPSGTYPNPTGAFPTAFNSPTLTAQTASNDAVYAFPIAAIRLTINSGTGTAQLILLQSGIQGG